MCGATKVKKKQVQTLQQRSNLRTIRYEDLLTDLWHNLDPRYQHKANLDRTNAGFWAKDIDISALTREDIETLYGDDADYVDDHGAVSFSQIPTRGPLNPDYTSGDLLFASSTQAQMTSEASLYFRNLCRLRLTHGGGPAAESSGKRYVIIDEQAFALAAQDSYRGVEAAIEEYEPRHRDQRCRLFEFDANHCHPSRGCPITPPAFSQYQINLLYLACSMKNNGILAQCLPECGL